MPQGYWWVRRISGASAARDGISVGFFVELCRFS
jgi:hypothetical protein